MICTEKVTFSGREYHRTRSDSGYMIERDGALYEEAVDPIDSGRVYRESDVEIADREITDSEALHILTGGVYGDADGS